MNKLEKKKKRNYTPYEITTIVERLVAINAMTKTLDFGTGEQYHTAEVHIMSYIANNPGITVTQLAHDWNRTTGAICQIIKKLEKKELVFKEKESGNLKNVYLYVTEKGKKVDEAHKEYDNKIYEKFLNKLKKDYSEKRLQDVFEILERWIYLAVEDGEI